MLRPAFPLSQSLPRRLPQFAAATASALVALGASWLFGELAAGFLRPLDPPVQLLEQRPGPIAERLPGRLAFAGAAPSADAAPLNLTLAGISASADADVARALIRVEGQPGLRIVAIGDEIGNGLRLREIAADAIILAGPAGDSRLALPKPAPLSATPHSDD